MDKDRLLTGEELLDTSKEIRDGPPLKGLGASSAAMATVWIKAQDQKTAALVEVATLRAVGEALLKHAGHATDKEIEALLAGKMPAGWERKE